MHSIFAEESATYEDKEQVRKRRVVAPGAYATFSSEIVTFSPPTFAISS